MNYSEWIERERRIRIKILFSSPDVREKGIFRTCAECDEICLCHEMYCPNCNSSNIGSIRLICGNEDKMLKERIRCSYRFSNIKQDQEG